MSSYKGLDLFGSGPHRTGVGRQAYLLTLNYFEQGGSGGASTAQGLLDLDVSIRGRLVASSEAALTALRAAIRAQLEQVSSGTLVDTQGRSWSAMRLVSYSENGRRDRGRIFSMRYTAQFRRFG